MKTKPTSFFIGIFTLGLLSIGGFFVCPTSAEINQKNVEIGEILVKFKESDIVHNIKVGQLDDWEIILNGFRSNPVVEYAEPNYKYHASIIPTDAYYGNQWYLQRIKAPQAWNQLRESPGKVIAVLDSGVQVTHPDLKDNIWVNRREYADNKIDDDNNGYVDDVNGWDYINNVADPSPKFSEGFTEAGILHGTIVSGIAAASGNNAAGISGVTWLAQIMPLKVLDDKGEGNTFNVVRAIDYAIANGADIINLSFTGFDFSQSLNEAVKRAKDAGLIVVAAAGNEEGGNGHFLDKTPMYPACNDGGDGDNWVIGVAATDSLDQKASFSSYGNKCVDIAAPGVSIFSTSVYAPTKYIKNQPFSKYYDGFWSGTSMATPVIAGSLALIEEANPSLNREQAIAMLLDNADNINRINPKYINQLGRGRVNLESSITQARAGLSGYQLRIAVSPDTQSSPKIKLVDANGKMINEFTAYDEKFFGGISIAQGDMNMDGFDEIITAPLAGGGPHIKVFNEKGELIRQFFAYPAKFRGGVNVASGDVDGDGSDEIITAPLSGEDPLVKIFNSQGKLLGQFLAFTKGFKGGVNVAVGDIDSNGSSEIITAPAAKGGPQVKMFNSAGKLLGQFMAYDKSFRGGVRLAAGNIGSGARNSGADIITAAGPGGSSHIRIFNNRSELITQFFAFNQNFRKGTFVSAGDFDQDGRSEIIVSAGAGGTPHVRAYKHNGVLMSSFYAYSENFSGGVRTAIVKTDGKNDVQ